MFQFFLFFATVIVTAEDDCGKEIFIEESTPIFLQTDKVKKSLNKIMTYGLNKIAEYI